MTDDCHTIFFAKLHKLVGIVPVPCERCRVNLFALHAVFGNYTIEVLLDDGCTQGVTFPRLIDIDCHTNEEFVTEIVFESYFCFWGLLCAAQERSCTESTDK